MFGQAFEKLKPRAGRTRVFGCIGSFQTSNRSRLKIKDGSTSSKTLSPSVRKISQITKLGAKLGIILSSQLPDLCLAQNPNLGCNTSNQETEMSCTQVALSNISATQNPASAANAYGTAMSSMTSSSNCWESSDGVNAIWEADIPATTQVASVAVFRGKCDNCNGGTNNTYVLKYGSDAAADALYHTGDDTQAEIDYGFWANLSEPALTKLRIGKLNDDKPLTICEVYAFSKRNIAPDADEITDTKGGNPAIFSSNVLSNACDDKPDLSWISDVDCDKPEVKFRYDDKRALNSIVVFACLYQEYNNTPNSINYFSGYLIQEKEHDRILEPIYPQLEIVLPDNTYAGEEIKVKIDANHANLRIANVMIFMPTCSFALDNMEGSVHTYTISDGKFNLYGSSGDAVLVPIPNYEEFVYHDTNNSNPTIVGYTQDKSKADSYTVNFKAVLSDGSIHTASFTLNMVDPCGSSVLTNLDQAFATMQAFVGYSQTQSFTAVEVENNGAITTDCGTVSYSFSESSSPFSSLSVDGSGNIALAALSAGQEGTHMIDVAVTVSNNSALDTTLTNQLQLDVYNLASGGTIADTTVDVPNSSIAPISYNPFTIEPAPHPFTIDYTLTSTPDASAFVSVDSVNNQLDITADMSHGDSYSIGVVGTVSGFTPAVSLTETFTLTVQCVCEAASNSINDYQQTTWSISALGPAAAIPLFLADTAATDVSVNCNSNSCPVTNQWTDVSSKPAWATISDPDVNLDGPNIPLTDLGDHTLTFTTYLTSDSTITRDQTVTVTVTLCEVTNFVTDAVDHSFDIYQGEVVQDSITFTLTQTPLCQEEPVTNQFEITGPSTESIAADSSGSPWIFQTLSADKDQLTLTINTSSLDKVLNSYTITQTATLPNPSGNGVYTLSHDFSLTTVDKCATISINTNGRVQEDIVLFIGQEYEVSIEPYDIILDGQVETRCGQLIYEVLNAEGSEFNFLTVTPGIQTITLVDPIDSDANIYADAQLKAYVNIRQSIENIQNFDVRLYNLVSLEAIETQHSIQSPKSLILDFSDEFEIQPQLDPNDQFSVVYFTQGITWVTINDNELEFVTDANLKEGDHKCTLIARVVNSEGFELEGVEATTTITITVSHPVSDFGVSADMPPSFESAIPAMTLVPWGTGQTINMPARTDEVDASENIVCEAELGPATLFTLFDEGDCNFIVADTTTESNIGDYTLKIQLTNSLGLTSDWYSFTISIIEKSQEDEDSSSSDSQDASKGGGVDLSRYFISMEDLAAAKDAYNQKLAELSEKEEIEIPKAKITYVSNAGLLTLDFTKNMIITQEINNMISKRYQGFVDGLIFEDQRRLLQEKEQTSDKEQDADEQVIEQIVELNPYVQLVLKTQNPSSVTQEDLAAKQFTWEIIDFGEDQCNIKLHWVNPLYISLKASSDEINLQFIDFEFLKDSDGLILDPELTYQKLVPKQMKQDQAAQTLGAVNEGMESGMEGAMIGNFVSNMLMSGSLQYLWNMLRAQQLIVHLPLVNVEFPGNAQSFFAFLLKIASFDLFPTDDFYDNAAAMPERPALSPSFEALGYESTYFLRNLGSPFFFAFYLTIALLIIFKFRHAGCISRYKRKQRYILKLYDVYFWSVPLRFFFENFMIIIVCIFIQFTDMLWNSFWTVFSSLNSIVFLISQLFIVVFTIYMFVKKKQVLFSKTLMNKYFPLLENMNLHCGSQLAVVHTFFFMRRIIMAAVLVFFRTSTVWSQMSLMFCTVMAVVISNGLIRPFPTAIKRRIETFNEICIVMILYLLLCFTEFIPDLEVQYKLGWIAILINSLNIMVNLGMMFYFSFGDILRKLKQRYIIRRELKKAEQNKLYYTKKVNYSVIRRSLYMIQEKDEVMRKKGQNSASLSYESSSVSKNSSELNSSDCSIILDEDGVPMSVERSKPHQSSYSDSNSVDSINDSEIEIDGQSIRKQQMNTEQNLKEMMPHASKKKASNSRDIINRLNSTDNPQNYDMNNIHIENQDNECLSNHAPIRRRSNQQSSKEDEFYNTLDGLMLNQQIQNHEKDGPMLANSPSAYRAEPLMITQQVTYNVSREDSLQNTQARPIQLQVAGQQNSYNQHRNSSIKADELVDYELNIEEHKIQPMLAVRKIYAQPTNKNHILSDIGRTQTGVEQVQSKDNKTQISQKQESKSALKKSNPFTQMYNKIKGKLTADVVKEIKNKNKKALKASNDGTGNAKQIQKSQTVKKFVERKTPGNQKPKKNTEKTKTSAQQQKDFTNLFAISDELMVKQQKEKPIEKPRINKKFNKKTGIFF